MKKLIAVVQLKKSGEELNIGVNSTSPHQNKKALSPFYHKNIFDKKWIFSIKNIFYD